MEHIGSLMATMGIDIAQAEKNIAKIEKDVKQYAKVVETEFKKIEKEFNQSEKTFKKYADTIDKEINSVKKDLVSLEKQYGSLATTTGSSLDKVESKVKKHSTAINALLKTVRAAVLGYATVLATTKIVDFTTGIIKAGVELDSFERSLVAITKSQKQARYEFDFVNKVAQDYGLNLQALRQSYVGLLAATQKTNLVGEETRRLFVVTSAAASVLGKSTEDAQGMMRAFVQMISKGNVQAEELRGQLGDRLYGAFNKAAEAMGYSTAELNKNLKKGDVLASELIPKLTRLLEGEFLQAAKAAAVGPRASFEKLNTAIMKLQESIAEDGVLDSFADLADETTRWVKVNEKLISQNLSTFFKAIAVGGEISLKIIGGLANKFDQLANAVKFVSGLFDDINDIEDPIERTKATITELQKSLLDLYSGYNFVSENTRKQRDIEIAQIKEQIENYKKALKLYKEQKLVLSIDTSLGKNFDEIDVLFKELVDKSRLTQDDIQKNTDKALEKEIKATRKALDKIIADRKKAYETLLKQQEKYKEDISEYLDTYNLSDYDKKLYYLEKEVQAFKKAGLQEIDYAEYIAAKKQEIDNDYYEQQQKELDELAKVQQDAYDDLYDTVKGYTRDVIDDFDSMGDTLVGLAENIVKDIAAAFLTQNIVMLITLAAGSAIGLTGSNGVSYADMAGSSGNLLSLGSSAWNAFSGTTSSTVGSVLGSEAISSIGSSIFGSAWGTYGAVEAGTGAVASSGIVGAISSVAPYLAIAAAAIPVISSFFESEPEPRIGIRAGEISEYGYNPTTKDMSNQGPINDYIVEYFDAYFSAIDELTSNSVKDVLANTDWERIRVHPEDFDSVEDAILAVSDDVFNKFSEGFIAGLANGQFSGLLDASFFESIQADGESLLDTFINFGVVVDDTDDFIGQFTRQIEEFGESTKLAYENVVAITDIMGQVESGVSSITDVSAITNINMLTDSWYEMIDTLESVNATVDQVTTAQTGMAQVLGANITGLTADALQNALMQGGDINSIIESSIQSAAYADIAQKIADGYISGINEEIGQVWIDTGGDIQAVVEAMQNIDTSNATAEILALQESFSILASSAESVSGVAEAYRTVTQAIDGQLTVAQQFDAWAIQNVAAQNLFSEMMADTVTQGELESAVEAFHELGVEGDDLNNIISALADAFSDAADEMLSTISDIDSAQGNLIGTSDDPQDYLDALQNIVDFFKDTPSLDSIRGDSTISTFDADEYQKEFAEFVVNKEFDSILGRSPSSDYWSDALISGVIDLSDIHEAIIDGIDDSGDIVNEIFNRLFGRSASGSYWADALDQGLVSQSNLESSILAGASESDLEYYEEHGGQVEITNWKDFDAYGDVESHFDNYGSKMQEFLQSVSDPDFLSTRTVEGDFATSESEVSAALEILNAMPDVVSGSGELIESALDSFVSTIGNMDTSVLADIFGDEAATQISNAASAISNYESLISSAGESTSYTADAIDIASKQRELEVQILEAQGKAEEALALEREGIIEDLQDTYGSLSGTLEDLQEELWDLQDAADALEASGDNLAELIDQEYELIEARQAAQDNISNFIDGLYGSSDAPVQSMEYFEQRYAQLLEEAQNAKTTEDAANAVGTLTDFANSYLDFAAEYGGGYSDVFNKVVSDMESLSGEFAVTDDEITYLESIDDVLGRIESDLPGNIADALQDYINAGGTDPFYIETPAIEQGMNDIDSSLEIHNRISQAVRAGVLSLTGDIVDYFYSLMDWNTSEWDSSGRSEISDYLSSIGFSGGGIVSGPTSGYQLPSNPVFHGTEAIIPLNNGSIPIQLQGNNQNIKVVVKIGNRELKDITTEIIRTDPETQAQVRRVANG